ncbi:MAG: NYN domain-containing protein [Anaerolineae bacterium]
MHWLIDGHNLIGQMPNLRLDDPHDEAKLIEQLSRYRAATGHAITVVFDAGGGYRPGTTRKERGITVQFAPPGKTADQIIMRRVRRVKNPQAWMVVTSDRAVQTAAQHAGVRVAGSAEFARQLQGQGGSAAGMADAGSRADVRLSADEVDEWLDLFNRNAE